MCSIFIFYEYGSITSFFFHFMSKVAVTYLETNVSEHVVTNIDIGNCQTAKCPYSGT